jgi:hypothetical protein
MSILHVIANKGARPGQVLYQVYFGCKRIGNMRTSREEAEGYLKSLEGMRDLL